jgi:hypothetical protein
MNQYKLAQNIQIWAVAGVVVLAVGARLYFQGLTGQHVAEAVKDLGIALMPLVAAVVAAHLVTRHIRPSERYRLEGERALRKISATFGDVVSGPKFNRENYGKEDHPQAGRYLFVQKDRKGPKVQLVPSRPLKEGVLEIRVYKTTLSILDLQKEQTEVQKALEKAVRQVLKTPRYARNHEIIEHDHENICLAVDFDEHQLGYRKFHKAVYDCTQAAVQALRAFPRG